ncbi:MAG: ABC transporter permease subunit, partial [Planctomycetota bacterium]|nr:ABC transporter permease subunit [Planctomycetota bacterium]
STVALSIAAICLAGLFGGIASLLAARTLATPEPFLPGPRRPSRWMRFGWRFTCTGVRILLIFLRAIPEYAWAYLFKAMLGLTAWPAVLALAAHNGGILGRLNAEVVENLDPRTPRAMRALGAGRLQIAATALFPAALNRFLLYFFYRWETCVREATVLGLLGFVSLGWFITDAQVRTKYDEMVLFVLLGSAIILIGDLLSALARGLLRRAR